jgi:TM2 domain-containing membrane protein YozV
MRLMVKHALALLALVTLSGGIAQAVDLTDSPVREAMRLSIAGQGLQSGTFRADQTVDEFGAAKTSPKAGRKSLLRAALFSAIVPGAGQYYLGNRRTARCFFVAEAVTWVAYLSFHTYGDWRKDDYINYAAVHANAQLEGKNEEYLSWVGFYSNIREFNTLGRVSDTYRPYLEDTPANHWEWQTTADQRMYRDLRNGSKEAYRRADFMIGAAIVDRIISVIDAIRSASRLGRRIDAGDLSLQQEKQFRFTVDPLASSQLCFTIYPGF